MNYDALKMKEVQRWHTKIATAKHILCIKQKKNNNKQQTLISERIFCSLCFRSKYKYIKSVSRKSHFLFITRNL